MGKGVKKKESEGLTTAYHLFELNEPLWNINPEVNLLYLDAGAWQGDEKGKNIRTNFVLVSGKGVALCNYFKVPSYDKSNIDYLKYLGTKGEGEFKECEPIIEFLKIIDPEKPLSHVVHFYRSTTKPFWNSDSLLIVIGDLHLHLFCQRDGGEKALLDNFIKKEGEMRKSLEEDFCNFLNKIYEYKKNRHKDVKVVQAGDILDIWEIEYVFQKIYSVDPMMQLLKFWLDEGVLKKGTIPPKVNPPGLKAYVQKNIFFKICASINNLKSLGIHFIILQGNHDDVLGNSTEFNEGPDYLVHVEHGHRFDSANEPGGDWLGRFLTKRNVDFESLGLGDWFKSLEEPASKLKNNIIYYLTFKQFLPLEQRETYLKASLDVSSWFMKNKGKNLSIFIMAHTHIPYAEKKPRPLKEFTRESIGQKIEKKETPSLIIKGKVIDKKTSNPIAGARIDLYRTMVRLTKFDKNIQKYKYYSKPATDKENKLSEELEFGDYPVLEIKSNYPNGDTDYIKIKSKAGEGWICSKWKDNQGKLNHTALLFDEKIKENNAMTAQDGSFNINVEEKQYYKLRIILKDYFDAESDRILPNEENIIKIEMEQAEKSVKESDIISLLSNFKDYDYNLEKPRFPYPLYDTFNKNLLAEDNSVSPSKMTKQTNCVSFSQALLVKGWENKVPNFTWSKEKYLNWMIDEKAGRSNRFSGIKRVISDGMGIEVTEENTANWNPPPWTIVQGFKYPENSDSWGSGHNFIIVDAQPETKRLLILEANIPLADRGSQPKKAGPQLRALGHIDKFEQKNYSPGSDWWNNKDLPTWDKIKKDYPYLKMARLKVYDLKWVK